MWTSRYWLINAIAFQLGWFVCVLLGTWAGVAYTLVAAVLHFRFAPFHRLDWLSICIALPLGVAHDNLLAYAGVLDYSAETSTGLAPFWLTCLWVLLALTFNHSLHWFYQRPWVLALMSLFGGPMAYFGGVTLSDVQWALSPIQGFLILMAIWVWLLPLHRFLVIQGDKLCLLD